MLTPHCQFSIQCAASAKAFSRNQNNDCITWYWQCVHVLCGGPLTVPAVSMLWCRGTESRRSHSMRSLTSHLIVVSAAVLCSWAYLSVCTQSQGEMSSHDQSMIPSMTQNTPACPAQLVPALDIIDVDMEAPHHATLPGQGGHGLAALGSDVRSGNKTA